MSFLMYQRVEAETGRLSYRLLRSVSLAGRGGLIHAGCRDRLGNSDGGWTLQASDLLRTTGCDPDGHALVIDTDPKSKTVNLYEIRSVSGYSYAEWTPVMIVLQQLFCEVPIPNEEERKRFKQRFNDGQCPRTLIRTLLYLAGGRAPKGGWQWGGNSPTSAALLWPDAWAYFTSVAPAS